MAKSIELSFLAESVVVTPRGARSVVVEADGVVLEDILDLLDRGAVLEYYGIEE